MPDPETRELQIEQVQRELRERKQAEEADLQADELEQRSEQLGEEIAHAREDWERKQADPGVPGATGERASKSEDDEREPWPDE